MRKKIDNILMGIVLAIIPLLETIFVELNWIFFESYKLSKIFTIIALVLGVIFVMSWAINITLYTIKEKREKRLKKESIIKRYE